MNDETNDPPKVETPFHYHLELTPAQLKITHTALHSLLDDFGHDQADVIAVINEVLAKLPDDHAVRAIQLEQEVKRLKSVPPSEPTDDDKPPPAA